MGATKDETTIGLSKREFVMNFGKLITATAIAMSMVSVPALAAQPVASKLAVAPVSKDVRAGASVRDKNSLAGGSVIIAVLAAAAVIAGIIIAADGDDDAVSP